MMTILIVMQLLLFVYRFKMSEIKCKLFDLLPAKGASINTYCRNDLFKLLEDNLPLANNEVYSSQISSILTLANSLRFSGQLVHYVLCHEVVTKKKNEMWFKLCGKLARFSIVEFAAIIGLNCNEFYDVHIPECNSFFDLGAEDLDKLKYHANISYIPPAPPAMLSLPAPSSSKKPVKDEPSGSQQIGRASCRERV